MRSRERLATAAAVLFWLAVWQTVAAVLEGRTGTTLLLPYPAEALARLLELVQERDFWLAVGHSVGRIFSGYAAGVVLGCAIGIASAFLWPVRVLLRPLLGVIRATPVASFVIVALVWIRGGQLSAFIACLMVLPIIAENVETGLRETDPALLEMAAVFQVGWGRRLRYIDLPAVLPYLTAGMRVALGFGWKSGIAGEVIAIPSSAIGTELYRAKVVLDMPGLFAWTAVIIALSALIEWGMLRLLPERKGGGSDAAV